MTSTAYIESGLLVLLQKWGLVCCGTLQNDAGDSESTKSGGGQSAEAVALSARDYVGLRALVCGLPAEHLKEMMAERGIAVDHSTVHRWAVKLQRTVSGRFERRKSRYITALGKLPEPPTTHTFY